jgi:hypothetical protein
VVDPDGAVERQLETSVAVDDSLPDAEIDAREGLAWELAAVTELHDIACHSRHLRVGAFEHGHTELGKPLGIAADG